MFDGFYQKVYLDLKKKILCTSFSSIQSFSTIFWFVDYSSVSQPVYFEHCCKYKYSVFIVVGKGRKFVAIFDLE